MVQQGCAIRVITSSKEVRRLCNATLLLAKIWLVGWSVVFVCVSQSVCLFPLYRSQLKRDLHQTSHTGRHQGIFRSAYVFNVTGLLQELYIGDLWAKFRLVLDL